LLPTFEVWSDRRYRRRVATGDKYFDVIARDESIALEAVGGDGVVGAE